jgi:hypothetical protein
VDPFVEVVLEEKDNSLQLPLSPKDMNLCDKHWKKSVKIHEQSLIIEEDIVMDEERLMKQV